MTDYDENNPWHHKILEKDNAKFGHNSPRSRKKRAEKWQKAKTSGDTKTQQKMLGKAKKRFEKHTR